jgi:pimeloyl-ACP methyl ester carboxylesterase
MGEKTAAAPTAAAPPEMPAVPGFTHRYIETPGLRTHVATIGAGDPVVLLHGFPQHWWQWRQIGKGLAERYQVICPDLRGAGWTKAATPRIARLTRMDDLLAVLDAMELDRVRLVAHGNATLTAMQLAYARPDRVRAMVTLSEPPFFMPFSLEVLPAMRPVPRFLFHRRGRSIAHAFEPPYVASPMPPETVATYLSPLRRPEIDAAIPRLMRAALANGPRMAGGTYRRDRLRVPSLYAFGEKNEPLTEPFVRKQCGDTARYAEHVEFASVAAAAYFVTDDRPDAVEDLVRNFFERMG